MAEVENRKTGRRLSVDPANLLVGLLSLGMAIAAFVGEVPHLAWFDLRWMLALGAVLVGVLLLVGSLRGRRSG